MQMKKKPGPAFLVLALLLDAPTALASGHYLWDQSDLDVSSSYNVSALVIANDFTVASETRLDGFTAFIGDGTGINDGVFTNFSGTLSWAIYDDGASGHPGSLIASGTDLSPSVSDTGLNDDFNDDIFRVTVEFTNPVSLASGTYWLAIHEGDWLSTLDGTVIWWCKAAATIGMTFEHSGTTPTDWEVGTVDNAFTLHGSPTPWAQDGIFDGAGGWAIDRDVAANDFVLAALQRFSGAEIWVLDGVVNDNGLLDNFGGTIGWALYDNNAGKPGNLLASGQDASPSLTDSKLDSGSGLDIFRIRFSLGGTLSFQAGTYWLALREGDWGSAGDGTAVYLSTDLSTVGYVGVGDHDEVSPSAWDKVISDTSFVLLDDMIFASGFEAGVACAWSTSTGGTCP